MKHLTTLLLTLLVSGGLWADDDILNLNCLLKGDHNFANNNLSERIDLIDRTVDGLMAVKDGKWIWSQVEITWQAENSFEFTSKSFSNGGINLFGLGVLRFNHQVRYVLNRNTGTLFAQVYKDQNYNTRGWEKVDSDILESSFSADCSKVNSERLF